MSIYGSHDSALNRRKNISHPLLGMSLLLHEVQLVVQEEFELEPPVFRKGIVTADDKRFMAQECETASPFDPENRRQGMLRHVTAGGGVCEKWTCRYGSVILLLESKEQRAEIPLGLWARILRLYAIPGTALFRVFLFGLRHPRQFPPRHEAIKATRETAEGVSGLAAAGPWVLLAVVLIAGAAFIWFDRRKKLTEEGV
jgi:hypothetical protein